MVDKAGRFITRQMCIDAELSNRGMVLCKWREEREMSTDKWAYDPERCDGHYCCGDCDNCMLDDLMDEDEQEEIEMELQRKWGE